MLLKPAAFKRDKQWETDTGGALTINCTQCRVWCAGVMSGKHSSILNELSTTGSDNSAVDHYVVTMISNPCLFVIFSRTKWNCRVIQY